MSKIYPEIREICVPLAAFVKQFRACDRTSHHVPGRVRDDGMLEFEGESLIASADLFGDEVEHLWPSASNGPIPPSKMGYGHVQNALRLCDRRMTEIGRVDKCTCGPNADPDYEGPCTACARRKHTGAWIDIFRAELKKRDRANNPNT